MTPPARSDRRLASALGTIVAWGAGIAFIGSLAYFVFFYGILLSLDATDRAPALRSLAINALLFTVFAAHHSLMARPRAKAWLTRLAPAPFERAIYVWVASGLFFALCWWWQDLPGRLYRVDGWAAGPFRLAQLGGVLLALRSARTIDVFELSGIQQVRGASSVDHPAAHEMSRLETAGPYQLVRHPIYLGTLLLMLATPDMTSDRLLFSALSFVYLVIGIWLEERSLRAEFGSAYDEYQRAVRWRLVPGIY